MSEHRDDAGQQGEYGPGGYLPPRAAKRARKIVLREQMGAQWPIAAVVAGVLIVLVTLPFVLGTQGPPAAPFVEAGQLDAIDPSADGVVDVAGEQVLVLRAGGVLRAFVGAPEGARWCGESRRIESPEGQVWTAEGRLLGGAGDSLDRAEVRAYEGTLYVDPTDVTAAAPPLDGDATPACAG